MSRFIDSTYLHNPALSTLMQRIVYAPCLVVIFDFDYYDFNICDRVHTVKQYMQLFCQLTCNSTLSTFVLGDINNAIGFYLVQGYYELVLHFAWFSFIYIYIVLKLGINVFSEGQVIQMSLSHPEAISAFNITWGAESITNKYCSILHGEVGTINGSISRSALWDACS